MSTDVSEDVASILRVEGQAKKKTIMKQLASLLPCRHSVFYLLHAGCLAYSPTLKMEATCSPGTSVAFQRITWRYIPEDRNFHKHNCENLKSYFFVIVSGVRFFALSTCLIQVLTHFEILSGMGSISNF
jgi:hypothetical protein